MIVVDCTAHVRRFREVMPPLWNNGFRPVIEEVSRWDRGEFITPEYAIDFEALCESIWETLVLSPLDPFQPVDEASAYGRTSDICVIPPAPVAVRTSEEGNGVRRWEPWDAVDLSKATLCFRQFFDWDQMGRSEFAFVEAEIVDWEGPPAVTGQFALIPQEGCRFELRARALSTVGDKRSESPD